MNLLKAICWVLGILVAALFIPILIIIASVILTIAGTVGAIYVVKALYDLETDYDE